MKLTVGRIVHFDIAKLLRAGSPLWAPAVCTYRYGTAADLFVFPSTSWESRVVTVDVRDVADGVNANNDTWRWPPREGGGK